MNNSPEFRRECEARHVLKMSYENRQHFYEKAREKRGVVAVDELIKEVKRQEANHVLKMNRAARQEYYKVVLETRGRGEVNKLISEVNKQRRRENSQEMAA